MPLPAEQLPSRLLRSLNRIALHSYHQVTCLNPCPYPKHGPGIIAANHTSGLDPLIIQSVVSRPILWMMAREYLHVPFLSWLWKAFPVIPVARDGRDSSPTRAALRALEEGHLLGIFPEGRISPMTSMLPLHPGIALLAARSKTAIYPTYLSGSQRTHPSAPIFTPFVSPSISTVTFAPSLSSEAPNLLDELNRTFHLLKTLSPNNPEFPRTASRYTK